MYNSRILIFSNENNMEKVQNIDVIYINLQSVCFCDYRENTILIYTKIKN